MIPKNYLNLKNDERGNWLKLVYHNSSQEVFFKDEYEALFTISSQKYSILKLIDNVNRYNKNNYEFLLEYPDYSKTGYNWWSQTKNPINAHLGDAIGYHEIENTWPGAKFGGLICDNTKHTFLKGSYDDELWFYAIGSYQFHGATDKFPGPRIDDENGELIKEIDLKEVNLWIRISNLSKPFLCLCTKKPLFLSLRHILTLILTIVIFKSY